MQQRIGVFGGTFDPIHKGHLRVAEAVAEAFAFDQLVFVPAFVPPHKREQTISSPYHRYAMLVLATQHLRAMKVSTIELEAPARPYTIETLGRLQEQHVAAQLFFLMGADSFEEVSLWREHERLLSEYRIIVTARPGQPNDSTLTAHLSPELQSRVIDLRGGRRPTEESFALPHIYLTDYVAVDISATRIRQAAAQGQPLEHFVPEVVASYIEKYQLYRKGE